MKPLPRHELAGARVVGELPSVEMVDLGFTRLDQWYSDFVETDWRYIERFYQTDTIPPWTDCIVTSCPLIGPAPIPALRHKQVKVRFAF
jgi:hypothetical protein